ncbi:hypothetical protein B0T25DRAFT_573635 [Lasiosphaeria hispida]|uniref:CAP-Gly domain-containing protein n=1 Tax=Lasiosphaeria hispida TaxID=260671 RepID=A0AAJ0M8B5_9PEZI|nr:hypothetical protein B0T25DRAFT_573635 [Lasiosphaeria hispida]
MATISSETQIGQRRSYDGALCTVGYIGEVAGTTGSWLGVEWDDASRGKHDGQHKGLRYFSCKSKSPTAASFIRPSRPVDAPQTFVSALQLKYVGDPAAEDRPEPHKQIVISGKVAQEIGFDKIRREQAQLAELKIIILDGSRVAYASHPSGDQQSISQVCPKVTELDLSRNLFNRFGTVVEICSELGGLNALRVRGNRFQDIPQDKGLDSADRVFRGTKELAIDETLLEWPEICHLASKFVSLNALFSSANQLSVLSPIPPAPFTSTLVSAHLEFNEFTSVADLAPLASITSLRNLHLKANQISTIVPPSSSAKPPVFTSNLHYLDVSYNQVASWSFVDSLAGSFPGLTSLRFAHNPIYDNPDLDNHGQAAAPSSGNKTATNTDESYMLMLARLPTLKTLNFSAITPADRANAEMFYLSRIARQLAAVPEAEEAGVLARHRRWAELCSIYGEPSVVRQRELDPNFLEARLIGVQFYLAQDVGGEMVVMATRTTKIPKSFDIYTVKGIAGKLFGLPPLRIKLVWETGEWDPVAGFDEEAGDSSDEEELEAELERKGEEGRFGEETSQVGRRGGRWVKRETELKDGPRQFGYCVDGLEVKIRLEMR